MDSLEAKTEHALHEVRIIMLGTHVLLGFALMFPFLPKFNALPSSSAYLGAGSLYLLLLTIGLLWFPISYHRLVEPNKNSEIFQKIITGSLELALLPFAFALGIDMYIPAERIIGFPTGLVFGVGGVLLALFLWYGLEFSIRAKRGPNTASEDSADERRKSSSSGKNESTSAEDPGLDQRIKQVLTEVRIVLPGLQALLGFQFATTFHESFDRLPEFVQLLHLASLGLVAVSIMLLMSPAAYHRIVEEGQDSERLHRYSSLVVIAAMALLALGLAGDLFVVIQKVTGSMIVSLIAACLIIFVFYGLWFGYTLYLRHRFSRHGRSDVFLQKE